MTNEESLNNNNLIEDEIPPVSPKQAPSSTPYGIPQSVGSPPPVSDPLASLYTRLAPGTYKAPPQPKKDWGDLGEPVVTDLNVVKAAEFKERLAGESITEPKYQPLDKDRELKLEWAENVEVEAALQQVMRNPFMQLPTKMFEQVLGGIGGTLGFARRDPLGLTMSAETAKAASKLAALALIPLVGFLGLPAAAGSMIIAAGVAAVGGGTFSFTKRMLENESRKARGADPLPLGEAFASGALAAAPIGGVMGGVAGGVAGAAKPGRAKAANNKSDLEIVYNIWAHDHPQGGAAMRESVNMAPQANKNRQNRLQISDGAVEAGKLIPASINSNRRQTPIVKEPESGDVIIIEPTAEKTVLDAIDPTAQAFITTDIRQLYDIKLDENGLASFDGTQPIKNSEQLNNSILEAHNFYFNQWEANNPGVGGADYLTSLFARVDEIRKHYTQLYNDEITNLFEQEVGDWDLITTNPLARQKMDALAYDPRFNLEAIRSIMEDRELPPEWSGPERLIIEAYKNNLRDSFMEQNSLGILVNNPQGFFPIMHDIEKIIATPFDSWHDFTLPLLDQQKTLPNLEEITEAKIRGVLKNIYDSTRETYGSSDATYAGEAKANQQRPLLYFKNPEAVEKYLTEFGNTKSVIHNFHDYNTSMARVQALYQTFGINPAHTIRTLRAQVENNFSKHKVDEQSAKLKLAFLDNLENSLLDRTPTKNYSRNLQKTLISQIVDQHSPNKASASWSLMEEPLFRAFTEAERRNVGAPAVPLGDAVRPLLSRLMTSFEVMLEMSKLNLDREIIPDTTSVNSDIQQVKNSPASYSAFLKKYIHTPMLDERLKAQAAREFEAFFDRALGYSWLEIIRNPLWQHLFEQHDFHQNDWEFLANNKDELSIKDYPWLDMAIPGVSDQSLGLISIRKLIDSSDTSALGLKLQSIQQHYVQMHIDLGISAARDMLWPNNWSTDNALLKLTHGFRDYMGEAWYDLFEQIDRAYKNTPSSEYAGESYTPTMEKFSSYYFRSFQGNLLRTLLRSLLNGETVNLHDPVARKQFMLAASLEAIPTAFSALTLNSILYGFEKKDFARRVMETHGLGVKADQEVSVTDLFWIARSAIENETREIYRRMNEIVPSTGLDAMDILSNRVLFDCLLPLSSPEAYKEMQTRRKKAHYYNVDAPLFSTDVYFDMGDLFD